LKRDYLENNYLVFIRPILEYASEVWDNCRQTNCNRLEKIQIEVARIVTGLSIYGSLDSKEGNVGRFLIVRSKEFHA
jgi:lysozyme family protein